jgi:hypothetical protein
MLLERIVGSTDLRAPAPSHYEALKQALHAARRRSKT